MWLMIDLVYMFCISGVFSFAIGKLKHEENIKKYILRYSAEVVLLFVLKKISFGYAGLATGEYFDYVSIQLLWLWGVTLGNIYVIICQILEQKNHLLNSSNKGKFGWSIVEATMITSLFMGGVKTISSHMRYLFVGMALFYLVMILVHWVYVKCVCPIGNIKFEPKHLSLTLIVAILLLGLQFIICGSIDLLQWNTLALNVLLLFVVLILLMLLFGNMNISIIIGAILNMCWTLTHYYVYRCRGTALVPIDFAGVGTAARVASNYLFTIDRSVWLLMVLSLSISVLGIYSPNIIVWSTSKRQRSNYFRIIYSYLSVFLISISLYGIYMTDFISIFDLPFDSFDQINTYNHGGLTLGFIMFAKETMLTKPDGYNDRYVELFAKEYMNNDEADKYNSDVVNDIGNMPDIIVIMNESWAEIADVGRFEADTDYMPLYHSMERGEVENTVTGRVLVSTLGGGTCNSEYEFLTGCSMELSPQMQPFVTEIKANLYSVFSTLQRQGYYTSMTHPADENSWNRKKVYSLLGTNDRKFIDSYPDNSEYVRSYMSDIEMYRQILEWYPENGNGSDNKPLFCFGVTIQNHGSYFYKVLRDGDEDIPVHVSSETKPGQLSEYLSLVYESDTALEYLVDEIDKRNRPTILVMFGDHFPGGSLYKSIDEVYYSDFEYEEMIRSTPFLIHTNFDCDMTKIGDYFSLPYLNAEVLRLAGVKLTPYQRYLLELEKQIPLINSLGYKDSEGIWHELDEIKEDEKYMELIKEYNIIQYNFRRGNMSSNMFGLGNE